jgi:hypothetical protein
LAEGDLVLFLLVGAVVTAVVVVVALLFTRKDPFECPAGKSVVATVRRHGYAGPMRVTLEAAGIDTEVLEEPAKSVWRRAFLGGTRHFFRDPPGPWYVVVPADRLVEALQLLSGQSPSCAGPA